MATHEGPTMACTFTSQNLKVCIFQRPSDTCKKSTQAPGPLALFELENDPASSPSFSTSTALTAFNTRAFLDHCWPNLPTAESARDSAKANICWASCNDESNIWPHKHNECFVCLDIPGCWYILHCWQGIVGISWLSSAPPCWYAWSPLTCQTSQEPHLEPPQCHHSPPARVPCQLAMGTPEVHQV